MNFSLKPCSPLLFEVLMLRPLLIATLLASAAPAAFGQVPKPADVAVAPHWIYDDVPAAFAKAKETGKPILALFR
jgi:hypothetical protein